jgi:hypothetical protein
MSEVPKRVPGAADGARRVPGLARRLSARATTHSGAGSVPDQGHRTQRRAPFAVCCVLIRGVSVPKLKTLFETAYLTGAHEEELLALRWTDLELPKEGAGKMAIRRSLSWARIKGEEIRPRYFPPKTKAGRRVTVPAVCRGPRISDARWTAPGSRSAFTHALLPRAGSRTPAPSDITLASPQLRLSHDRGRRSNHRGPESARP